MALYDFSTGRVAPGDETTDSLFSTFEQEFPWPGGYALDLKLLPYAAHALSLIHFETFVVEHTMSADDYVGYLLGETNVEASIVRGLNELDACNACQRIFGPLFSAGSRHVGFDCVLAIAACERAV